MSSLDVPPLFMQNRQYSARIARKYVDAVATEGVYNDPDFLVTERLLGAALSVDVSVGRAAVVGTDQGNQGTYLCFSEFAYTLSIPPADVTNGRVDLVVLRVRDPNAGGDGGDDAVLEVIEGVPSVSPSAPALPDSSLALAEVSVAAAATSITNANITDKRRFSNLPFGGIDVYKDDVDRAVLAPSPRLGATSVLRASTTVRPKRLDVYNGDDWVPVGAVRNVWRTVYTKIYSDNPGAGVWEYVDDPVDGLQLRITVTPESESSVFLLMADVAWSLFRSITPHSAFLRLVRDDSATVTMLQPYSGSLGSRQNALVAINQDSDGHRDWGQSMMRNLLIAWDSPETTSELVYGVQYTGSDLVYINQSGVATNSDLYAYGSSNFTLWELDGYSVLTTGGM